MKKIIFILLCACLLLAGCAKQDAPVALTQAQIDEINDYFDCERQGEDGAHGHFGVNGFFTSAYDDVRDLNLKEFLKYFNESAERDISEEEFTQLKAIWTNLASVETVSEMPVPITRYPAAAVEAVLREFAGIGLEDLMDMQEPFSGYAYLKDTDAFYTTTSDYAPGYFICTSGEVVGDTATLYGEYGARILTLRRVDDHWYIQSLQDTRPEPEWNEIPTVETTESADEQEAQSALPTPSAEMYGLTGREAVLFDAAVAQKYPREDNDIVLPRLRVYGSFEEDGKTVVICALHYDFYYDYTGPGCSMDTGGATTFLRAELETRGGAEVCTGFTEYPSGNLSDWIRDNCGPLAVQDADGLWALPEAAGEWFPADEHILWRYLGVIEGTAQTALERFYALAALPEEELEAALAKSGSDMTGAASADDLMGQYFAAPCPVFAGYSLGDASIWPARGVMTMRFDEYRAEDGYQCRTLCDAAVSLTRLGDAGQCEAFSQTGESYSDGAAVFTGMEDGYAVVFRFFCTPAHADKLLGNRAFGKALSFTHGTAQASEVSLRDEQTGLRLCVYPERLNDYAVRQDGALFTFICREAEDGGELWRIRCVSAADGAALYPEHAEALGPRTEDGVFILARSDTDWYLLEYADEDAVTRGPNEQFTARMNAYSDSLRALDGFARDNGLEENPYTEEDYCAFLRVFWDAAK